MPTENPKISAYVPQAIYDCFKQFQEERGLSMSQAATELFAEYFGINLASDAPQQFTSGLPSRLESLESQVNELRHLYSLLSERVDFIQSTSRPLLNMPITSDSEPLGKLLSNPLESENITISSEPIGDIPSELPLNVSSEPDSESLGEPRQISLIESIQDFARELLSEFESNPLQTKLLATRLKIQASSISGKRKEFLSSPEKFSTWLQEKDPDFIKWIAVGVDRVKGYIPANDTPLEKLESLQRWLKTSI